VFSDYALTFNSNCVFMFRYTIVYVSLAFCVLIIDALRIHFYDGDDAEDMMLWVIWRLCSAVLIGVISTEKTSISLTDGDAKLITFYTASSGYSPAFKNIRPGRY